MGLPLVSLGGSGRSPCCQHLKKKSFMKTQSLVQLMNLNKRLMSAYTTTIMIE